MNIPKFLTLMHDGSAPCGSTAGIINIDAREKIDPSRPAYFHVEKWPRGGFWPSISSSNTGLVFLTSDAVEGLKNSGLTGFDVVRLPEIRPYRVMPPNFKLPDKLWILTPTGRVRMVESELFEICVAPDGTLVQRINRFVPELEQPLAKDFSLVENTRSHTLICTMRVVETFRSLGWKNIRFSALDLVDRLAQEVDPLSKKWPPQWYPDGVEPHPNNLAT
jgi:hypothetical protein